MKTHPIIGFLNEAGQKLLLQRTLKPAAMALTTIGVYLSVYFLLILTVKSMSLTWGGLVVVPALVAAAFILNIPVQWWRLRDPRRVARFLEHKHPELQLSVRTGLDFLEGRVDQDENRFQGPYLDRVYQKLSGIYVTNGPIGAWVPASAAAILVATGMWFAFEGALRDKFYNPTTVYGQTHLNLAEGSITIFEPEYTQIPGRTLPLKSGTFNAFPGSKVRFMVQMPEGGQSLYLSVDEAEPIPMRLDENKAAVHEFVLMQNTALRFLLGEGEDGGRTDPFNFEAKVDGIPELQIRSNTPEGPINVMDPLIVELEVKDDFGVKELEAVINWDDQTRRIPLGVPANRRKHFLSKNRWYLSDFDLGDAERFTIHFEAGDNNPINGPGVGRSDMLAYELESPDKKYDEFMEIARELLDTMTHTLGDNLETEFAATYNPTVIDDAEVMGRRISKGLYSSLGLTNTLITKVRETPNLTRLDQNFLYSFRNGLTKQARTRSEIGLMYANVQNQDLRGSYRKLVNAHRGEEIRVEGLTYELLLQLKMWAVFEMERQNNKIQEDLESLEELLENSENMDQDELMELVNKMMEQIMSEFQEMMSKAAQEMDQSMSEFMNSDAMQEQTDAFEDLKKQIMEALKEGDTEKAKALMEELKMQMQSAYESMQQQMGEMSPEMQAMMQDMRELQGLLNELKRGEEELEKATRDLKQKYDKEMGGNRAELDEQKREEYKKATENIQRMLNELYNKLVDYKTEEVSVDILKRIAETKDALESKELDLDQRESLMRELSNQEALLDFISRNGLDQLQTQTLKNIKQTEKFQEYLDQGELLLSLESGNKLDGFLNNAERFAERTTSRKIRQEARPAETFNEARQELHEILNALMNMRNNMEEARREFMEQQQSESGAELAEKQEQLRQMIQEFMERTGDTFGGTQIEDRLREIARSMDNAEQRLGTNRLEGGLSMEQQALQQIGEMMEQLQQSSRPNGSRPMPMSMRRQGQRGDPLIEDIYIPESEKKARQDRMKDEIRKRLGKNLPSNYGKEIRKYYDKLMDQ